MGGELVVGPVAGTDGAALVALFDRAGCSCFCRYWHFAGDKNAWQERCARAPERNREELLDALAHGASDASGVVARTPDAAIVGWLKLAPALALPKLHQRRPYAGLPGYPGDRDGVMVVGCLLVEPAYRRQGVSRRLVAGAIAAARAAGARAIEAFPHRTGEVPDELLMMGPWSVFTSAGFRAAAGYDPYPILRLDLR
ncbi:MAG: GNAT family N-acetyltransferase [Polyangiaceae bacterium]|nr:GNAT family N-acetyltransferase [Polyangiaceae bacterium]